MTGQYQTQVLNCQIRTPSTLWVGHKAVLDTEGKIKIPAICPAHTQLALLIAVWDHFYISNLINVYR